MKKLLAIIFLACLSPFVYGQDYKSEIEFFQSAYGLEKKAIVENFMELEGESATNFWTIYNEYETERQSLGKDRLSTLSDYADQYETLTNEQADAIMLRALAYRASNEKLLKKYYKKVKKVTDAKTAARFIQLETYLGTAISYAIMESIPFVGEM